MQRVRMSLPYLREYGWDFEIVAVKSVYSKVTQELLLEKTVPESTLVHWVDALSTKWVSKIGLGSIAIRSLWYYLITVNRLLKKKKFDLIYFSTTQFPVCILGAYWKKKFGIQYVIDMQDPWHSDYYQDKPKAERPPKYWFSYRLNKWLEPIAMNSCDGIISVSLAYIHTLKERYPHIKNIPERVITFGASLADQQIVQQFNHMIPSILPDDGFKKIVYIGRGGYDMHDALRLLFTAFNKGLKEDHPLFSQFKWYFMGTSYAAAGQGKPTIQPLAGEMGLEAYVLESTDRVPYFSVLKTLKKADVLVVPGSNHAAYTASKIFNYILAEKPLFCLFHPDSSVLSILKETNGGVALSFESKATEIYATMQELLSKAVQGNFVSLMNKTAFNKYTDRQMTKEETNLFNQVIQPPVLSIHF